MSAPPEPDFDLEKLFLPAWAQDAPQANRYANFAGEDRSERKYDERQGRRPPRRDPPGGTKPRRGRPEGADRKDFRPDPRAQARPAPKQEAPPPPLPLGIAILPEEKGVESPSKETIPLRFEAALDELMLTLGLKTCELVLAPAVITEGAIPGLEMELK